jgi:CDP-glucose 4,6-dehydratase
MNSPIINPSKEFWTGKRVFVTGHTGFKGGWLTLWLHEMGAKVHGYSLDPPTKPSLFEIASVNTICEHEIGDIRDFKKLEASIKAFRPDVVMHLAAQPILRYSYDNPRETYDVNVIGTVNVLEAIRSVDSVQSALIITTDKCYENKEQIWAYRETDRLGGFDPYSSSKACAELVVSSYARSFFKNSETRLASVRAGNVIGGGDWAQDRLMTDIVASLVSNERPEIRNPAAIRPWQHVLEPLSGYLLAAEYLWRREAGAFEIWNFGPEGGSEVPVEDVARQACKIWGSNIEPLVTIDAKKLHEATYLKVDSAKAAAQLNWHPRLELSKALLMTIDWHKKKIAGQDMRQFSVSQIAQYVAAA